MHCNTVEILLIIKLWTKITMIIWMVYYSAIFHFPIPTIVLKWSQRHSVNKNFWYWWYCGRDINWLSLVTHNFRCEGHHTTIMYLQVQDKSSCCYTIALSSTFVTNISNFLQPQWANAIHGPETLSQQSILRLLCLVKTRAQEPVNGDLSRYLSFASNLHVVLSGLYYPLWQKTSLQSS